MKLFIYLTFLMQFVLISSISLEIETPQNISILSKAICEIIEKEFAEYSRNVDIIDIAGNQSNLVSEISAKLNSSITVTTLQFEKNQMLLMRKLESHFVVLCSKSEDMSIFDELHFSNLKGTRRIRILVYCKEFDLESLPSTRIPYFLPFSYFIGFDHQKQYFKLFTCDNNNDDIPGWSRRLRVITINEFSSDKMKWTNEPLFTKKYKNFHGNRMTYGVQYSSCLPAICQENTDYLYIMQEEFNVKIKILGLNQETIFYNKLELMKADEVVLSEDFSSNKIFNKYQCRPQLYIPTPVSDSLFKKIIMTFGINSWMVISVTIFTAFLIFFLLHICTKKFLHRSELLDIFRVVFGIRRIKMTTKSFLGMILMIFVIWFTAIRIGYQGKMFEFSLTDQKAKTVTLQELRDRNFTVYFPTFYQDRLIFDYIVNTLGLSAEAVVEKKYVKIYKENLLDPEFNGAVFVSDAGSLVVEFGKREVVVELPMIELVHKMIYPIYWAEQLQDFETLLYEVGLGQRSEEYATNNLSRQNLWQLDEHMMSLNQIDWKFLILFLGLYLVCFLVLIMEVLVYRREGIKMMIFDEMDESDYLCIVKLAGWLNNWLQKAQTSSESDTRSLDIPSIVVDEFNDDISINEDNKSKSGSVDGISSAQIINLE